MRKEFIATFQITRMVLFSVNYYTLGSNKNPHFSTTAEKFIRSKLDYSTCGQCQEHVLPKGSAARKFFKKWDEHHLHQLTDEQLEELHADLEVLKENYNYLLKEQDTFQNDSSNHFSFSQCKNLSMLPLKKRKTENPAA